MEDASLAFRTDGYVGSVSMEVLAIESRFAYITWYRGDFSSRPVNELVADLRPGTAPKALLVPDGASVLGLWVKVDEEMPRAALSLWVVLEDATGALRTLVMGEIFPSAEWVHLAGRSAGAAEPPGARCVGADKRARVWRRAYARGLSWLTISTPSTRTAAWR